MLKMLGEGDLVLTLTDGSIISKETTSLISSNTQNYDPIFGVDEPTQWRADKDLLDDLADTRE